MYREAQSKRLPESRAIRAPKPIIPVAPVGFTAEPLLNFLSVDPPSEGQSEKLPQVGMHRPHSSRWGGGASFWLLADATTLLRVGRVLAHYGVALTFQQLAKKAFGGPAISTRLDEDVDDVANLIDAAPEILPLSLDGDEDLVQVPCVSRRLWRRFSPRAYSGPNLMHQSRMASYETVMPRWASRLPHLESSYRIGGRARPRG